MTKPRWGCCNVGSYGILSRQKTMKAFLGMSPGMAMLVYRSIGWIAMQFCTDIRNHQMIKPTDFGDTLTFTLASQGSDL